MEFFGTLREFKRTFWLANVMELFERAAYYGLNSVLAVYLTNKTAEAGLGFSESSVGFLQGVVYAATYVVPILGGALADRYGYRRMLIFAFSLLATGYFAAGCFSSYALVFLALLIMACGSGLFKPIISGTIAKTTSEKNSALGFGIYYWMINLGAFVAPLLVTLFKGFSWQMVFVASAAYCAAMLVPTIFLFVEPPRAENKKTLAAVLEGATEVLGDARFVLMIVVYSGFWILYFQNFGTVLWFLRDFVDTTPVNNLVNSILATMGITSQFHMDAEHVTVINAGTIIALQVWVSALVKEKPAMPTMMAGMGLGALGFLCLAFATTPWIFIAGIVVFSLGEMTAHPKYYSYVGTIAPHEKKALYMGYAFLYGVFGALIGSNVGGFFYEKTLKPVIGTPEAAASARWFWLSFVLLDLIALAALWFFNRAFSTDTPEANQRARKIMWGVYVVLVLLGGFAAVAGSFSSPPQFKMIIQGSIFVLIGGIGVWTLLRGTQAKADAS